MSKYRTFKQTERTIAKRLPGGRRTGHQGATADVQTDWLSCECKHRQSVPQWLTDAMQQSKRNAQPDQLAIVIVHQEGDRHSNDLVFLTFGDFLDWFGDSTPCDTMPPAD